MERIERLEQAVADLYAAHHPKRADWADWLAENHVFIVADNASRLAKRYRANEELARAAALLHDIADTKMSRFADGHRDVSKAIARELMQKNGFTKDEISLTVDDAINLHGCYNGAVPESIEGKILSTADSEAHLLTDFYVFAAWSFGRAGKSLDDVKRYVLQKIERDFFVKIQFDEERERCQAVYAHIKRLFSIGRV